MSPVSADGKDRPRASPLARRLAAERGLSLARIAGSGPGGRIVAADIPAPDAGAGPVGAASGRRDAPEGSSPRVVILRRRVDATQLLDRLTGGTAIAAQIVAALATLGETAIAVSDLGATGIDDHAPLPGPGDRAALGIGAARLQPVAMPDGSIAAAPILSLTLSLDPAAMDDAAGAQLLALLVARIGGEDSPQVVRARS